MEQTLLVTCALGAVAMQIFLSTKDSAVPGLILPILAGLLSFLFPFSMTVPTGGVTVTFVLEAIGTWLLANIPTVIFIVIYLFCRGKFSRKSKEEQ